MTLKSHQLQTKDSQFNEELKAIKTKLQNTLLPSLYNIILEMLDNMIR